MNIKSNAFLSASSPQMMQKKANYIIMAFIAISILSAVFQLILILLRIHKIYRFDLIYSYKVFKGLDSIVSALPSVCLGILGISLAFTIIIFSLMMILIIIARKRIKIFRGWWLILVISIVFMLPLLSPCFILGFPLGIYSLIFLMKSKVRSAFR